MPIHPKKNAKKKKKSPAQDSVPDPEPSVEKMVPEERIIFARNLQAARKAAGLTQGEASRLSGLTQPFISEIENGKVTLSLDNAAHLAAAVGQTLRKLLTP